jgi:hypothetical protein
MRHPAWPTLLATARWAPSPHNIQPWRLRVVDDDAAELLCAADRLLPDTDPTGRFSMVGLGVFLETLAVAARAHGADVESEYTHEPLVPNGRALIPFARLRLADAAAVELLEPDLIEARRTSRLPYDGRPVEPHVIAELERVASAWGHRARFSTDRELVDFVLDLNRETLFHDLSDDDARREVGRWLRFSGRAAAAHRDGFSPDALGFPGTLLFLFFHARRVFDLPGIRGLVDRLYMRTMRGTRTIGVLQGPFESPDDWIRAGRMLARFWLTMTRAGVQLHPFGSIITNEDANRRMRERLAPDPRHGTPWLIVRLGYSAEAPRSHRLRTDELLVR